MLELINQESCDLLFNVEVVPPKYNLVWGTDYILMDSKNFKRLSTSANTSGEEYETIINMFNNIWNTWEYRLLENNIKL